MPTEPTPGDVTEFEERACIVSRYDEECEQVWLDDDEGNPFAIGMDEWATCVVQINAYEATRLLAPFKQPEVAELLARADLVERELCEWDEGVPIDVGTHLGAYLDDLYSHARALAELAEAQAKLAAIEGLGERWRQGITSRGCAIDASRLIERADELAAALAGAGGEREVAE